MKKIITLATLFAAVVSGAYAQTALDSLSSAGSVPAEVAAAGVPEPQLDVVPRAAKPITAEVQFKSRPFAELLVNSLNVKPKFVVMPGGMSYVYKIGEGLTCYKSFADDIRLRKEPPKPVYSCVISPAGGWKALGMESYGAGDNRKFSLELYAALKVKETNDEGIRTKSLALERPDGDGGTERNHLSCVNPSPELEAMGFRPTCQLINGL